MIMYQNDMNVKKCLNLNVIIIQKNKIKKMTKMLQISLLMICILSMILKLCWGQY